MLSLVICRIFFGELFKSFVHFQIRFHFYCWGLSFYFQLQSLYHMNASWVFSSILWKVFSVFCYCSFKCRLKLSYNLNHPSTGHHAQLKSCSFPVCTRMHARASATECVEVRGHCLSPSFYYHRDQGIGLKLSTLGASSLPEPFC